MRRRDLLGGLSTAVAAGLAGCAGVLGSSSDGGDFDVGMSANAFDRPELTVEVGDTVTWRNTSQRAHTVTAYGSRLPEGADFFASGGYDSTEAAREAWADNGGAIFSTDEYEHTFETAGEHAYFCIPHERSGMVATVVVEE